MPLGLSFDLPSRGGGKRREGFNPCGNQKPFSVSNVIGTFLRMSGGTERTLVQCNLINAKHKTMEKFFAVDRQQGLIHVGKVCYVFSQE